MYKDVQGTEESCFLLRVSQDACSKDRASSRLHSLGDFLYSGTEERVWIAGDWMAKRHQVWETSVGLGGVECTMSRG